MRQCVGKELISATARSLFSLILILWYAPAGWPGTAPPRLGQAPDGRPLYLWQADRPHQGGTQFDDRLNAPVVFWHTGAPLQEVFGEIERQTGVHIGVLPPGDDNERICVTLYLNSDDPPSLRALMVQLSWVTGCTFASDDHQQPRYYLLHASKEGGALERVRWEREEQRQALYRASLQVHADIREEMLAKLPELREALALSREEAIQRYRGRDDCLLLAALDPERRATAAVVLAVADELLEQLRPNFENPTRFRLSRLTPEQHRLVRQAVDVYLPTWQRLVQPQFEEPDAQGRWTDWSWVEETDPELQIVTGATFFSVLLADPDRRDEDGNQSDQFRLGHLEVLADPRTHGVPDPETEIDLRQLLGEEIDKEEQRRIRADIHRRRSHIAGRRELEAALRGSYMLSADTEVVLSDLRLPIEPDDSYAPWQIQELVAAASGLHVISDCFVQDPHSIGRDLDLLRPEAGPDVSALLALALMCRPRRPPHDTTSIGLEGWRWGDAGPFLRFRSREAGLCRAAFLPQPTCKALDDWLAPHLPKHREGEPNWPPILVPVDVWRCARLQDGLSPEQITWGRKLVYADPSEPLNAYRQSFREWITAMLEHVGHVCSMLAGLREDQWDRLLGEGIVWGVGFSAGATERDREHGFWTDRQTGDVLRLVEPSELALADIQGDAGPIDFHILTVLRDGKAIEQQIVPLNIYVAPSPVASLVARRTRTGASSEE